MTVDIIKEFLQCRPVDDVSIRSAVLALLEERNALRTALMSNPENRRKYAGKITDNFHTDAVCSCGETVNFNIERKIPWSVISNVLKLAQKNAESA